MSLLVATVPANSSMKLKDYQSIENEPATKATVKAYLQGVYKGALLFDSYAHRYMDKESTSFCTKNVVWSGEYPQLLLNKEIENRISAGRPYPEDMPIELIMFEAMRNNISC